MCWLRFATRGVLDAPPEPSKAILGMFERHVMQRAILPLVGSKPLFLWLDPPSSGVLHRLPDTAKTGVPLQRWQRKKKAP
jgi:hypothetical protein